VIKQNTRVERVIEILGLLPLIPHPDSDFTPIELLTPREISQVMNYLKDNNPGIVAHIWRARQPFGDDMKFDIRQILLNLAGIIVTSGRKPVKLHRLS